jgi:hypothetical protein
MTKVRQVNGQIYNWGLRAIHQRLLGMTTTQILGSLCNVLCVLPTPSFIKKRQSHVRGSAMCRLLANLIIYLNTLIRDALNF